MGVYFPRMKMPSSCWECGLKQQEDEKHWCPFMADAIEDELIDIYRNRTRRKECPAVEVSTPHGRLLDEDTILPKRDRKKGIVYLGNLAEIEAVIDAED